MKTFITQLKTTGLLLVGAIGLFAGSNALAATAPGVDIINSVDVDYEVGGVNQPNEVDTTTMRVDRLIDVVLSTLEAGDVAITPGAPNAPVLMRVTNNGNDDFDVDLSAVGGGTATAPFTAVDGTNTNEAFLFYIDDGDGVFEPTTDDAPAVTSVSNLQDVDSGLNVVDFWVDDGVPGTVVSGEEIVNTLTIQITEVAGVDITTDDFGNANAALVQEDLFGTQLQTNADGTVDFGLGYTVAAAIITATKVADVISDPLGQVSPNANAVPGAVIEYTLTVANDALATADADLVDIRDDLDTTANITNGDVVFDIGSITLAFPGNANVATGKSEAADADECEFDDSVANTLICAAATLQPGESAVVVYSVTIQ